MLPPSPDTLPQTSFFDLASQLNSNHPLLSLGHTFDWDRLERSFAPLYSDKGRAAKPIRLMCGLLMLKQLYDLSDESVVDQWQMNPYFQVFCGATELVKFRQRIGVEGVKQIFGLSVSLHGTKSD